MKIKQRNKRDSKKSKLSGDGRGTAEEREEQKDSRSFALVDERGGRSFRARRRARRKEKMKIKQKNNEYEYEYEL
jgi:hypothetical protein